MNKLKTILLSFIILLWSEGVLGQPNQVEMATNFRGEGKIYVVVAVMLIILIGIFVTLLNIEKKLKQMESKRGEK